MSDERNPYEPFPNKTIRDWVLGIGEFSEENLRKSRQEAADRMVEKVMAAMQKRVAVAFLQQTNHDAVPAARVSTPDENLLHAASELGNPGAASRQGEVTGNTPETDYWLIRDETGTPFEVSYIPKGHKRILAPGYSKVPLYEKPQPGSEGEWQKAALTLGESLSKHGPGGYYEYTPDKWLRWARQHVTDRQPSLTQEERSALQAVVSGSEVLKWPEIEAVVRSLLERMK